MYATILTCTGSASHSCRNANALDGCGLGRFRKSVRSLFGHSMKPKPSPRGLKGRMLHSQKKDTRPIKGMNIATIVDKYTSSRAKLSARALKRPCLDDREVARPIHSEMVFSGVSRNLTDSLHLSKNPTLVSTSNNTSTISGQQQELVILVSPDLQESVSVRWKEI